MLLLTLQSSILTSFINDFFLFIRNSTVESFIPHIEDITFPRVDMNFIFECSTQYLTSEHSERVSYRVEHGNIKFISTSGHVIFCLLYKHTNDDFFDDYPKISEHFQKASEDSKILETSFEGQTSSENLRGLPKISEDNRRFLRTEPMRFRS